MVVLIYKCELDVCFSVTFALAFLDAVDILSTCQRLILLQLLQIGKCLVSTAVTGGIRSVKADTWRINGSFIRVMESNSLFLIYRQTGIIGPVGIFQCVILAGPHPLYSHVICIKNSPPPSVTLLRPLWSLSCTGFHLSVSDISAGMESYQGAGAEQHLNIRGTPEKKVSGGRRLGKKATADGET